MEMKRGDHHVVREKTVNEYGDGAAWFRGPLLGKGSYGRVYKATLKINRRSKYVCFPSEMAVKAAEVSVSSTLQKEREIMSNLKGCPYVIQCFGEETTMGYNGELAYNLLLEYGSGGSLADRIRKSGGGNGLPELEAKAHTRSILRGLNHIHGMGYVHCDLKPDNILLVPGGGKGVNNITEFTAKIGDFGLAKKRESLPYPRGTPMYLSPEAVNDYVQEAPSDVWAVGCIVLEMLTGKRPWEGKKEEIFRRIGAENELPKINSKEISEDARHFLKCCFERKSMYRLPAELLLRHPFLDDLGNDDVKELEDSHDESTVVIAESDNHEFSCDHLFSDDSISSLSSSNNAEIDQGFVGSSIRAGFDKANEIMSKEMSSRGISERIIQLVLPILECI